MERQMAGGPDGPPALAFVWLEKLCFYLVENVRTNIVPPRTLAVCRVEYVARPVMRDDDEHRPLQVFH